MVTDQVCLQHTMTRGETVLQLQHVYFYIRTLNGLVTRSNTVGNSHNGTDTLKVDILKMRRSKSQEVMSRNNDVPPKPRRIDPLTNKTGIERKSLKKISKSFERLDRNNQRPATLADQVNMFSETI